MNEYEKYQLQWMLDHNHSIREMITRLGEIAFNEMSNDVGLSFDKIMDEAFEIFEYEQGFKNEEIWLCKDEWEHDLTKNSQAVARPDWMEEDEILIDRDNDYVLLRDPDENVNQVWTASGKFLSTVQLENETVVEAMEEYYYNITKGGFYIPDRIKEGYMEEDYDNLSKEDIEL